ncbi:hypothetical protein [Streptococcus suis]
MIENVKIEKTFLGIEVHGILTCYLTVKGRYFEVSVGGNALDSYDEVKKDLHISQSGAWIKEFQIEPEELQPTLKEYVALREQGLF